MVSKIWLSDATSLTGKVACQILTFEALMARLTTLSFFLPYNFDSSHLSTLGLKKHSRKNLPIVKTKGSLMPSVSEPVTASLLGKNRVQSTGHQRVSKYWPLHEVLSAAIPV